METVEDSPSTYCGWSIDSITPDAQTHTEVCEYVGRH